MKYVYFKGLLVLDVGKNKRKTKEICFECYLLE